MSTTMISPRHGSGETHGGVARGTSSLGQSDAEAQKEGAEGLSSNSQERLGIHPSFAVGSLLDGHVEPEAHRLRAVEFSSDSQHMHDDQERDAVGLLSPAAKYVAKSSPTPRRGPILRGNGYLSLLADTLDDFEGLRTATANRVRALTRDVADSDGEIRGLGLDERSPEVAAAKALLADMERLEHQQVLQLQREFRKNPLSAWQKREKGVGEKQAARLLAVIGDPYWNDLHDRPRTVSELWAYCGYHVLQPGVAARRKKGAVANWSTSAKTRAYLIAESCLKARGGRYEGIYRDERTRTEGAVHSVDCVRCGPAGKPALAGSALSAGHLHARALRKVAKEILKDLWLEARSIHEGGQR